MFSLIVAGYYGSLGLGNAFRAGYVVQDDAREYVFWMQKFIHPELFPHDIIADYFRSITPLGYAAIYHVAAVFGVDPLLLSKLLPFGLGLIASIYCFFVCFQLFPVPIAGFISTLLLNQSMWFKDDLASAAPRAFIYPLFLAFLYYLPRRSQWGIYAVIVLQGLIYPPLLLISMGILAIQLWDWKRWRLNANRQNYVLILAIVLGLLAVLPYLFTSSQFGPTVTAAEARMMPEFWAGGRHPFFNTNFWWFWLVGQHSGIVPPLLPPLIWVGLLLPIVLRYPSHFPLVRQVQSCVSVLSQTVWVSFGFFFAAHALLLKLFFPTRYTQHTLRVVLALAAGIVLTLFLDAALRAMQQLGQSGSMKRRFAVLTATIIVGLSLITYPMFFDHFPRTNYRIVKDGSLYQFLLQKPKNSLIASLSTAADYVPTFAQRSVLVAKEYALPFHHRYYREIRQRTSDLIQAQYSPDLTTAKQTIQKYGITLWMLDREAFDSAYLTEDNRSWLSSFQPAFRDALATLTQGTTPALEKVVPQCSVFENVSLVVLDGDCIVRSSP